jgi:phosphatidylglycerophosphate synthase
MMPTTEASATAAAPPKAIQANPAASPIRTGRTAQHAKARAATPIAAIPSLNFVSRRCTSLLTRSTTKGFEQKLHSDPHRVALAAVSQGELWTREILQELRAGHYSPASWQRFLSRSLRRAADTRAARPSLARQARAWSIMGFGLIGVSWAVRRRMGERAPVRAAAWWTSVSAMLDWHLGMVERADGVVSRDLGPADALTLTRFWLVPFAACRRRPHAFAALVGLGAGTDLLDGRLAASLGPTRLGRDLDTMADLSFFGAAALGARRSDWLSRGAALTVLARQAVPAMLGAAHYFARASRPPDVPGSAWTSGLLVAGLALAPIRPKAGNALVIGSSLALVADRRSRLWFRSLGRQPC